MDKHFGLLRRPGILIGLAVLLIIIIAAYIDGGEEAVRPIEQKIEIPLPYQPDSSLAAESPPSSRSSS